MPSYSDRSTIRLESCHEDLQLVFNEVIKFYDVTILYGHRSAREQFELFKKGRRQANGVWVIGNKSEIVTYRDGTTKPSKHQKIPSVAIDIIPYPFDNDWYGAEFHYMAGVVLRIADELGIGLRWGGRWTWKDRPHFELT